jgi:hypothetical protein
VRCRACDRIAWHWGWFDRARSQRVHMTAPTCSPSCSHIWGNIRAMTDPNAIELAAMAHASDRAGEYIEALGKTDMARWSHQEWAAFIEAVCGGYVESLCHQQAEAMAALSKVQAIP